MAALEVFRAFLVLGLTSFGGPVAHLGYFREAFVVRRRWLDDHAYADLMALCQFLPGPTSSQVAMAIGLGRAGWLGLVAALVAFTLPSAALMIAFALELGRWTVSGGATAGLAAAAVAVVALAVVQMARALTPDAPRAIVAIAAAALALAWPTAATQVAVIVGSGLLGVLVLPDRSPDRPVRSTFSVPISRRVGAISLAAFGVLLVASPLFVGAGEVFGTFYRAGALVFGGGHVVLPLLQADTAGWVGADDFLAGYGIAQAMPGPLFSFAGFLGALSTVGPGGVTGGVIALVAIFLPAALLVLGCLPFWESMRSAPLAGRALAGVNAGVVGLLAAALWDPVISHGIVSVATLVIAALALVCLLRLPAWLVVIGAALAGAWIA